MDKPTKTETKICESCGEAFECGAKIAECWCFNLAISPKDLAKLNQQYQNCLCRACLEKIPPPEKKNTPGIK